MPTKKNVELPDIGDFDSVDIIEVLVKVGDNINENDSIITLETDKATMEIPAPFSGRVVSIAVKVDDKIAQGELILTLESESEDNDEAKKEATSKIVEEDKVHTETLEDIPSTDEKIDKEIPESNEPKEEFSLNTDPKSHASPSIRKLARELGVSLLKVNGTGQKGRILEEDLKSYVKDIVTNGSSDETEILPLSRIKKKSGKHLIKSWNSIPHVTQFDEVNVEQMERFRKHQKERGIKLSPLVFIMKAIVQVLKRHPNFNASLDENNENLILKKFFSIGIAVDTPNGLVVPVIRMLVKNP